MEGLELIGKKVARAPEGGRRRGPKIQEGLRRE